jgi:hypothetical protein
MELISVTIKNRRQKSAGSLKKTIPTITVPTAPMPVQTAYAVPIGNVNVARYNRYKLVDMVIKKPMSQNRAVIPDVSFAFSKHVVNPISNNPAIINMIQFIYIVKLF